MRKLGRPRLAKSKARGRFISTRLTAEEYKAVYEAACRAKMAKTKWVRETLVRAAVPTIDFRISGGKP